MRYLKIYVSWLLVLLIWRSGMGQNSGTTAATFLKLGAGARATGMGSAFTGVSDDATAIFWNPAGLGFSKRWELSFNYQQLFADFEYQAIFYTQRVRLGSTPDFNLGLGIVRLGTQSDWNSTDPQLGLPPVAADDISDLAVILPLAGRLNAWLPGLAVGGSYKYIRNKLAGYTSHAHAVDWGGIYKKQFFERWFWSLGASLRNLSLKKVKFNQTAEPLPLNWRFGTAVKYYLSDHQDLTIAYDLARFSDNNLRHHLGLEYWFHLGSHRLGARAGYRFLDQDLGRLAVSVGYGFDLTPGPTNAILSQIDYALNNYDMDILGNVNSASFSLEPTNPEPFKRLLPAYGSRFDNRIEYNLSWEQALDYDDHDRVNYLVVVDQDSAKIAAIKQNARKIVRQLQHNSTGPELLFRTFTSDTRATFSHAEDSDFQDFYWAVIAYDRNLNVTIATGSDEIGKFSNRNLPDIKPVSLSFTPASELDTTGYQGKLEAKIIGLVKKPAQIVIYDSTEARTLASSLITRLAIGDTFTLKTDWYARQLGAHTLCVIADSGDAIAERNEANNLLSCTIKTIPWGRITVPDTVRIEELRYSHIELPTVPFVFFEANSTELARTSRSLNETDPDSVLSLLGNRLKMDFPGLKITLRGFIDPNSESPYQSGSRLSELRAEKIKEKIVAFGAQPDQVVLLRDHNDREPRLERKSALIPPEEQAMVNEENRRVEIRLQESLPALKKVAYEKSFFAPHRISRKLAEVFSEKIHFSARIQTAIPLKKIGIFIKDYPDDPFPIKIIEFDDFGTQTDLDFTLEWNGIKDTEQLIAFNKRYYYQVVVEDSLDNEFHLLQRSFYLARAVIVKEKRIFALAKFNQVTPLHQFYLEQLDQVEEMMKRDEWIRVRFYGHTDSIGTKDRNKLLSTDRATELASWLARIIDFDYGLNEAQKKKLKARIDNPIDPDSSHWGDRFQFGKGEHFPLVARDVVYGANASPQGRTLNRRVDIEIYRIEDYRKPLLKILRNITFHPWYRNTLSHLFSNFPKSELPDADEQHFARLAPEVRAYLQGEPVPRRYLTDDQDQKTTPAGTYIVRKLSGLSLPEVRVLEPSASGNEKISGSGASPGQPVEEIQADEILADRINQINCLEIQDSILWLGTELGLVQWNLETDVFRILDSDLPRYQRIHALKYDPGRRCLWIGTQKGLRQLVGNRWQKDFTVGSGLTGNRIKKILLDDAGRLIVGTNEGVVRYDGQTWQIPGHTSAGRIDDKVNDITLAPDGRLWVATDKGVSSLDGNERWQPFWGNVYLPSDTVLCLELGDSGEKWLGTAKGLWRFDRNDQPQPYNTFENAGRLKQSRILSLVRDHSNELWCATAEGLFRYRKGIWYHYDDGDGLPAASIQTILLASDHKKYLGTRGGGVVILE